MIPTAEIFEALKEVVNRAAPDLYVTADSVQNSERSYAQITFRPLRIDEGFGAIRRQIRADIAVVLAPDEYAENYHSDLYDIADALDYELCGYVKIGDRFITLYETEAHIFDNILHYTFILSFADYIDRLYRIETENLELMEILKIRRKENVGEN